MSVKLKRGESLKSKKTTFSAKKMKINFCKKFETNPEKFYSEIPTLHAIKYELKLDIDNEIISKLLINLENLLKETNKSPIHRKANSLNFVINTPKKKMTKKQLSIISDRSNGINFVNLETSMEKNRPRRDNKFLI